MTAKDDTGATCGSRIHDLRFTKPSKSRKPSKAKKPRKAAAGLTPFDVTEGTAQWCARVRRWVIRLDDGSGLSELGFGDAPKPEAPDASGLYHDRPIKEIGNARPAKSVKVPKPEAPGSITVGSDSGAASCDSAELAAIRERAKDDFPDDDRATLLRMVDELTSQLAGVKHAWSRECREYEADIAYMAANEATVQRERDELRAKLTEAEKRQAQIEGRLR